MGFIKEKYQRFRRWQENPFDFQDSHHPHKCCNCGGESDNNYCPRCGQKAVYGPITWKSVWQGVMDVWGVGTRSLPYSLWQLLWRPGYLMRDYISGKRQVSFPPVKMLVIVGIDSLMISQWIDPEEVKTAEVTSTGLRYVVDVVSQWLDVHQEWSVLLGFSFLILPIWSLFREAPKCHRHSLPQGFYIQVFIGTQFILVMMIIYFISTLCFHHYDGEFFGTLGFVVLIPLMLLIDFKQLFGYGWWGTLWRALLAVPMGLLVLKIFYLLGRATLYLFEKGMGPGLWESLLLGTDRIVLLWLLMEVVGVINRKEWRDDCGWWQVVKRPAVVALIYLVITVVCYSLGYEGGFVSILKSYIGLIGL
ncbi:MAG: DUF3667 domain-containing protein [Muribaculaceae bacterium]|nr:DUF3667 domain-containing protein [Muribaculaceae bacterium]